MAYINITGDSDGDLHDANMHNSKFGAIASVLNGNINRDNLANPDSIVVWRFDAGPGQPHGGATVSESWVRLSSSTTAAVTANDHTGANSAVNCLFSSWVKVPQGMTILSMHMNYLATSGPGVAATYQGYLQSSDTLTNPYTTIHCSDSGGLDWYNASFLMKEEAFSVDSAFVAAGRYLRFIIINPAANAYEPPKMTITLTMKTTHV